MILRVSKDAYFFSDLAKTFSPILIQKPFFNCVNGRPILESYALLICLNPKTGVSYGGGGGNCPSPQALETCPFLAHLAIFRDFWEVFWNVAPQANFAPQKVFCRYKWWEKKKVIAYPPKVFLKWRPCPRSLRNSSVTPTFSTCPFPPFVWHHSWHVWVFGKLTTRYGSVSRGTSDSKSVER